MSELTDLMGMMESGPDIVAVTEIKNKNRSALCVEEILIRGYDIYVNGISNDSNRGVAIYVKRGLKTNVIDCDIQYKEFQMIKIKDFNNRGEDIEFVVIYRSPNSDDSNNDNLLEFLNYVSELAGNDRILISGDFNYPGINWVNQSSSVKIELEFIETIRDCFWIQNIVEPTRVRKDDTPHILDLVFTNDDYISDIIHRAPLGKSDHAVLELSIRIKEYEEQGVAKLNFNKGDYAGLIDFVNRNWNDEFKECSSDIDQMWSKFRNIIVEGTCRHIPEVKLFNKADKYKRPLPMTVRNEIFQKHSMWNRFMRTRMTEDYGKFKKIRNKVRAETRKLDRVEQEQIAKNIKTNPKKFWNYIKSRTKSTSSIPSIEIVDDQGNKRLCDTDKGKADVLNRYFGSVFNTQNCNDMPPVQIDMDITTHMSNLTIDEAAINSKLKKLNINKSAGEDRMYPRVLCEVADMISYPLKLIFEQSLIKGSLPSDWKSSYIAPIYKKGKKSCANNYRPVSITSVVCKIFETIFRDHIMDYFLTNGLFNNKQYGFIKGRSTVSQLIKMLDEWTDLLEDGGQIDTVYTDLEKAFDKIPHNLLIKKLQLYNFDVSILNWIEAFLSSRRQRVRINTSYSDWIPVLSGIPQGSVLGPVLFIIYINDLVECCGHNSRILLYADDSKIYSYVKSREDCKNLQEDIDKIVSWFNRNLMKLNTAKCKVVSYGRETIEYGYKIGNLVIERVEHMKDLGITFDSELKFDYHIKEKVNKANSMLGIIKRNFGSMSAVSLVALYKSLVRSHLEYAESVWSPYRKRDIELIERVQMRAVKFIVRDKNKSYEERLRTLNLPTLRYRRIRGDMIEVYKIINDKYDRETSVQFSYSNVKITRGHEFKLFPEHVRYDLRKHFFTNRIVALWNGLSDEVVHAPSVDSFKGRLDKFWRDQELLFDYRCDIC